MVEYKKSAAREDLRRQKGSGQSRTAGSRGEVECKERLRFERLLSDLSARFIHVAANDVDTEIEESLRQLCEFLGLDLAALWQLSNKTPGTLVLTHLYSAQEGLQAPGPLKQEDFPWVVQNMLAGHTVVLSSLDELPVEASRDRETALQMGIKSNLCIPLTVGDKPTLGVLGLNTLQAECDWPEALVQRFELVAQVFANAIARKQADQALGRSEARLDLAAVSAGVGLWSLNMTTQQYWLSDVARKMFGFDTAEVVTLDRALEAIYAEDRDRVRQTIHSVMESGDDGRVEYRITGKDGTLRWLVSRGRMQHDASANRQHLMGITVDITEIKAREERLHDSEARLASAVEVAGMGFYEVVDGKKFTFLDNLGRTLVGIPEGRDQYDEIFQFWAEHLHPEDHSRVLELQRKQRESSSDKVNVEYRYEHPHRGTIWIHHLSHILKRNADGGAVRTIGVLRDITARKVSEENLRKALEEVQQLRERLEMENVYLREQLQRDDGQDAIVGESEAILHMLAEAQKVAPTGASVLITGETGTGKELLAQAIHNLSPRKGRPMVKVNCAALPAPLIEGELFGREKGAYTGAMTRQHGRFEVADGSTIFLDEIGDLPLDLQVKLLRVLQDGCFERLGSHRTLTVDVRVIAATNHDLASMVREGRFREDLFHRLNVFPIEVPPLRTREQDISMLVWSFVREFNVKMGRSVDAIPKQSIEQLKQYAWPGNVRELRNMVERAMITSDGRSLNMNLPEAQQNLDARPAPLKDIERKHIISVLEHTRWRIRGKDGAAEILGLVSTTLHSRMKKLGISRPQA